MRHTSLSFSLLLFSSILSFLRKNIGMRQESSILLLSLLLLTRKRMIHLSANYPWTAAVDIQLSFFSCKLTLPFQLSPDSCSSQDTVSATHHDEPFFSFDKKHALNESWVWGTYETTNDSAPYETLQKRTSLTNPTRISFSECLLETPLLSRPQIECLPKSKQQVIDLSCSLHGHRFFLAFCLLKCTQSHIPRLVNIILSLSGKFWSQSLCRSFWGLPHSLWSCMKTRH